MTLCSGCEGYVALEGGEEAISVAERRSFGHFLIYSSDLRYMGDFMCCLYVYDEGKNLASAQPYQKDYPSLDATFTFQHCFFCNARGQ